MTAALAKELDLQVDYNKRLHRRNLEPQWRPAAAQRPHQLITIGGASVDRKRGSDARTWTIDFLPPGDLQRMRTRPLDESHRGGDVHEQPRRRGAGARRHRRTPIGGPRRPAGRSGFRRRDQYAGRHLPARRPRQGSRTSVCCAAEPTAQSHTGASQPCGCCSSSKAAKTRRPHCEARLAALEPEPPVPLVRARPAGAATRRCPLRHATTLRARWRGRDYSSEFHYWLAMAHHQLGETSAAEHHLERAQALRHLAQRA